MKRDERIVLGVEAKDIVSGFSGIVISVTDWLNGCRRIAIQPKELREGKPIDAHVFDAEQVQYVGLGLVKQAQKAEATGGDREAVGRAKDPRR